MAQNLKATKLKLVLNFGKRIHTQTKPHLKIHLTIQSQSYDMFLFVISSSIAARFVIAMPGGETMN